MVVTEKVEDTKAPSVGELSGFDPLAEGVSINPNDRSVFEEATQRVIQNILKSYTGFFDLFSELLQNSLDAIDKKHKSAGQSYKAHLWIDIDIANRLVRVVDNGSGMSFDEVRFCFRPNVSFKNRKEARGHKGVGATFLAYGFGLIRLSTKIPGFNRGSSSRGSSMGGRPYRCLPTAETRSGEF